MLPVITIFWKERGRKSRKFTNEEKASKVSNKNQESVCLFVWGSQEKKVIEDKNKTRKEGNTLNSIQLGIKGDKELRKRQKEKETARRKKKLTRLVRNFHKVRNSVFPSSKELNK